MSLHSAARPLAAVARRQVSRASGSAHQAQAGPSRPSPPPAPTASVASSFDAINAMLGSPAASASSSIADVPPPITPSPVSGAVAHHAVTRGYSPFAIPPPIDPTIDLFTNMMMFDGKKSEAQSRMSRIMIALQETANQPALPLIHKAINAIAPCVRIKQLKRAVKSTLQPVALNERQKAHAAIAWILKAAERGQGHQNKWEHRICREILAVLEGESICFKWQEERHKQATLNRAHIEGGKYGY